RLKLQPGGPVQDLFQVFDDMHFHLIVTGQPAPADAGARLGDLLRTHVLPADPANDAELARAEIPLPSFYLVRPDGYIGICGGRLETAAIGRYLSERVRLTRQSRDASSQTLA